MWVNNHWRLINRRLAHTTSHLEQEDSNDKTTISNGKVVASGYGRTSKKNEKVDRG